MLNSQGYPEWFFPKRFSNESKDLLALLLEPEPDTRINIAQARSHVWVDDGAKHLKDVALATQREVDGSEELKNVPEEGVAVGRDITSTVSDLRSSTESTSSVADMPPDGKEEDIQENSVGTAIGDSVAPAEDGTSGSQGAHNEASPQSIPMLKRRSSNPLSNAFESSSIFSQFDKSNAYSSNAAISSSLPTTHRLGRFANNDSWRRQYVHRAINFKYQHIKVTKMWLPHFQCWLVGQAMPQQHLSKLCKKTEATVLGIQTIRLKKNLTTRTFNPNRPRRTTGMLGQTL